MVSRNADVCNVVLWTVTKLVAPFTLTQTSLASPRIITTPSSCQRRMVTAKRWRRVKVCAVCKSCIRHRFALFCIKLAHVNNVCLAVAW